MSILNRVSGQYFETAGISIVAGRGITAADTANSLKVAVVSQTLARKYFPKGDAIGRQLTIGDRFGEGAMADRRNREGHQIRRSARDRSRQNDLYSALPDRHVSSVVALHLQAALPPRPRLVKKTRIAMRIRF